MVEGFSQGFESPQLRVSHAASPRPGQPQSGGSLVAADQADKLEELEREVCHLFDANLTVSSEDARLLATIDPQAHFHVVENGTDVDFFRPLGSPEEQNTIVFAGSLDWYPNQSALQHFRAAMWPGLRHSAPGVRLEIAGRNPRSWLTDWAQSDPQVGLTASPEDIRPCIDRAAVFVCPIMEGGGTRLKLLDAMAMGKAIVTTSIGCEGLRVMPGSDLLIADGPADFNQRCCASSKKSIPGRR